MQRTYITYTSVYIQLFSFQKYHIWAAFLFCEKKSTLNYIFIYTKENLTNKHTYLFN